MNSPPEYLTEYLNKIAKNEGFVEHTLHYESGSNHGDGFIAAMVAVTIKGKQMVDLHAEKELSLMCKLLPENKARREFFQSTLLFEREVYVYNDVLPKFKQFQIERNISMNDGFFEYPKCYFAVADATKDHYVIIMENVKTAGYQLWDKMKPVDFDTSSLFLESLGRFHGLSFALRDQKPELFQKFLDLKDILGTMVESPNITNMMIGSIDKAIEHLIRDDEINLLKKIKANYKSLIQKMFAPNVAGRFSILGHGDCWNNNFCYLSDENIESLDDHSCRLLIKLALGGKKEWFNEFMVQPVSKAEYAQYGKVLNSAKYEEYKKKHEERERLENLKMESSESTSTANIRLRQHDNSSTDDEKNERQGRSSESRKHHKNLDKHSRHRDRSYSASDDEERNRDRLSKPSNRRESSQDSTYRKSKNSPQNKSSDDSDSDNRRKHSSSNRSSHKKTKSKKHFKSRNYSKDQRQRYYSSEEDEKHYKKKTKKSKRPRSRSRDRR